MDLTESGTRRADAALKKSARKIHRCRFVLSKISCSVVSESKTTSYIQCPTICWLINCLLVGARTLLSCGLT